MGQSDDELVRQARGGNRTAFEELVRRTSRLVYARLVLNTGDVHRAEDLLQETMLAAYRSLGQLVEARQFRSWLLTIAQNVSIDAARRDARQKRSAPQEPAPLHYVPDQQPTPDAEAQREEQRQRVIEALRALPEEYRLPLTLRYLTGSDYATIGAQLGLSNGSLRGLLHRGLKLLREKLPPEFGETS
jgi:RNA polymerase sigma-70 factor (ECF subfamily)